MGVIDDISLKVIDGDVEYGISNLRVAILKMLCLENFFKEEVGKENDNVTIILDGKAIVVEDKIESFLNKKLF